MGWGTYDIFAPPGIVWVTYYCMHSLSNELLNTHAAASPVEIPGLLIDQTASIRQPGQNIGNQNGTLHLNSEEDFRALVATLADPLTVRSCRVRRNHPFAAKMAE